MASVVHKWRCTAISPATHATCTIHFFKILYLSAVTKIVNVAMFAACSCQSAVHFRNVRRTLLLSYGDHCLVWTSAVNFKLLLHHNSWNVNCDCVALLFPNTMYAKNKWPPNATIVGILKHSHESTRCELSLCHYVIFTNVPLNFVQQ